MFSEKLVTLYAGPKPLICGLTFKMVNSLRPENPKAGMHCTCPNVGGNYRKKAVLLICVSDEVNYSSQLNAF